MSLKTGTHILQGWAFSGDKMALGVLICETLSADLLCSEGVSSFWTPRQEPENKQVMVKFWLTFLKGMKGSLWLFATPWTVTYQATLTMGFSRQDCWSALPFPSPGDLPDPGIEPRSPALQADALPSEPPGKPWREWHHHTCTSATWKKQSIQSCSGHEIGIKLRKHLFSSSTGHKD